MGDSAVSSSSATKPRHCARRRCRRARGRRSRRSEPRELAPARECQQKRSCTAVGKIVTLREVVADVYQDQSPSEVELQFTARPGGAPANVAVAAAKLGHKRASSGVSAATSLATSSCGPFTPSAWTPARSGANRRRRARRWRSSKYRRTATGRSRFTGPCRRRMSCWHPDDIHRESLVGASFANFGSIPLIKDPVRSATRKFAQLAIDMDVAIVFDVNLREHSGPASMNSVRQSSQCSALRQ